ncbi:tryptophan synthase subunit alpha [Erwinia sp. OLTSP20]|uniref:tryptophan synthase subunit alpha n=1 Tax=unclassified Erwinia TaxID=2622719 RepID=UPI000C17BACF|nr:MULTISPECIES: tryptophan synthase subunit alpha [unclassified Erwinia]PIJ51813.1 tryptophan synthase subunit alpha [Erwinia sp. OAMSP11]PIJ74401.1 tryptophan synthase subunit alpha [Erwinia sp. OLSSP12]PIJ83766.1 tryptophan synthase subunit alpha [Erwinia sp. OLCASP19]PIJ86809.1 tryptophan synthase subunit alpha [Erwinia sp. OLMTSP26]PIJ88216.1 tryptophan synthase subunit alpha [Erwinia sp. OLMDSP33]
MTRYQQLFTRLAEKKEGAFVPFVSLGDPSPTLSLQIIDALVAGGADALELGIPFSDPLADGPTIQGGNLRAFAAGTTPQLCFELLAGIRKKYPEIPIGLLMYANLVFHNGIDNFYRRCQQVDVDSVLIGDVPFEESAAFRQSAMQHNIAPIFMCPPNASDDLLRQLASHGRGYIYLQSRAGVTGTENRADKSLSVLVNRLREYHAAPAIQGFGISEPAQVRNVIASGAAGAIAGSATVKLIESHHRQPAEMLTALRDFTRAMKAATR